MSESKPDFPFYNGEPQQFTASQWWLLIAACVLGFVILSLPLPLFASPFGQMIPASALCGLPMLALWYIARGQWGSLFRPLGFRQVLLIPGFAFLNLFVSAMVALLIARYFDVTANPAAQILLEFSNFERLMFFIRTLPQLVGEELVTIIPFLAIMAWLVGSRGWSRRSALLLAWMATALVFGALHLPTYDWNVMQSLVIIGVARLVLTAAYIVTANLWVCCGAHILSDWIIFSIAMFVELPPVEAIP